MQFFLNSLSQKCKWNLSCFFLSLEAYTMRACDLCFTPKWMLQRKRLAGLGKETISSTTEMLSSKLPVSCHVSKSWRMFFGQSWGHKYWPIKITADSKQPIARVIVRGLDQLHAGASRTQIPFLLEKSLIVPNYNVVRLENTETILVAFCWSGFFKGCGVNLNRDGLILFTF